MVVYCTLKRIMNYQLLFFFWLTLLLDDIKAILPMIVLAIALYFCT